MNHVKNHVRKHLQKLQKIKREKYHPLIHKIHKKHKISKKTLFYVKEYGPHTHVPRTIIKESVKILLFASIISSFGGLALEYIKEIFISIIPLIILMPALNGMIGGYGSIISSRFSTMLHEGKIKKDISNNHELKRLFFEILVISMLTTLISIIVSFIVSYFTGYNFNISNSLKIFFIVILDVLVLVTLLFFTSIMAGIHYFKKKEDPNNFLIPIATSVADFGNMIILALLVVIFF